MKDNIAGAIKVEIFLLNGSWHAVLEREGLRRELDGLDELIRILQGLAASRAQSPARGLR